MNRHLATTAVPAKSTLEMNTGWNVPAAKDITEVFANMVNEFRIFDELLDITNHTRKPDIDFQLIVSSRSCTTVHGENR